jgi:hypothetical protein
MNVTWFKLSQRRYFRNQAVRFGGYFIVIKWVKRFEEGDFFDKIKSAKYELGDS